MSVNPTRARRKKFEQSFFIPVFRLSVFLVIPHCPNPARLRALCVVLSH